MKSYIKLILINLSFIYLNLVNCQIDQQSRSLQAWSSFTDCDSCNNFIGWVYLNDTWQPETSDLASTTVSDNTYRSYWHESLGEDFIDLANFDFNIDIYPYANVSLSTNSLCEWRMLSATSK